MAGIAELSPGRDFNKKFIESFCKIKKDVESFNQCIADTFIPSVLEETLKTFSPLSLRISTDDMMIPWELVPINCQFWYRKYAIGRFLLGIYGSFSSSEPMGEKPSILVITRPTEDFIRKIEQDQIDAFQGRLEKMADVKLLDFQDASSTRVREELSSEKYDWVYYYGHAFFDENTPSASELRLYKSSLTASQISNIGRKRGRRLKRRPIVFLNACETARVGKGYSRKVAKGLYEGLIQSFTEWGALATIGTLWSVPYTFAFKYAEDFFGELRKKGVTIGLAMKRAREMVDRSPEIRNLRALAQSSGEVNCLDFLFAPYVLYGDPELGFAGKVHVKLRYSDSLSHYFHAIATEEIPSQYNIDFVAVDMDIDRLSRWLTGVRTAGDIRKGYPVLIMSEMPILDVPHLSRTIGPMKIIASIFEVRDGDIGIVVPKGTDADETWLKGKVIGLPGELRMESLIARAVLKNRGISLQDIRYCKDDCLSYALKYDKTVRAVVLSNIYLQEALNQDHVLLKDSRTNKPLDLVKEFREVFLDGKRPIAAVLVCEEKDWDRYSDIIQDVLASVKRSFEYLKRNPDRVLEEATLNLAAPFDVLKRAFATQEPTGNLLKKKDKKTLLIRKIYEIGEEIGLETKFSQDFFI